MKNLNLLQKLIITGLGTGNMPVAPGTFASAPAAAAGWLLCTLLRQPAAAASCAVLSAAALASSIIITPASELYYEVKDPPRHVTDEIAGQFLTLAIVFAFTASGCLMAAAASFVFFRIFDITKPFPIRRIEKIGGGWGVSLDDIAAAVYAGIFAIVLLEIL